MTITRLIQPYKNWQSSRLSRKSEKEKAAEEAEIEARDAALEQPMPGVEVAFAVMRDKLGQQLAQVDGLDTKAGLIFASASLVTGVLVAWRQPPATDWGIVAYLPRVALLAYIGVVGCSALAFRLSRFHTLPGTAMLRDDTVTREPRVARYIILREIARQYESNSRKIKWKARFIQWAFWTMVVQVALVAIILFVEVSS
jgi:hypothetical protein